MNGYVRRATWPTRPMGSRLGQLDVELTERCNNGCIHCSINLPAADAMAREREMTTAQVQDLLTQAADLGCLQVRFTGGEPLLRPDFEELYLFARRLGLKVLIFTNARLLTPHLTDLLRRIPPLVDLEISVYGMHEESYEAVTGVRGSFAQFRKGVSLLLECAVPFVVKGALLPPNSGEVDEFEAWAKTIPSMTQAPGYAILYDLRGRRDDGEKNRAIASLRLTPQECLVAMTRDEAKYRREMAEFAAKFMRPPGSGLFACGAGHNLCVDAYGRAQPCLSVRAPELAIDLAGSSLLDALERYTALAGMTATDPDYLRRCARCFLKGLCEQCPAKSWAEHGTLDTPVEYLCEVAHAQARCLGWLNDDEHGWDVAAWRERVR